MVSKRDRILDLKEYIESFNISVNIAKNKAQGNKGFFKAKNGSFRIDIAKGLDEESSLMTLCHEFSHFIHYKYDKKLQSLDFIFDNINDELIEELIKVTINLIPKDNIKPLFEAKEKIQKEIKSLTKNFSSEIKDFKLSTGSNILEKSLRKTPYKYLLKYDRVKLFGFFSSKLYSITDIKNSTELSKDEINYLIIKSKQRALKRINSKINKLNRYYNSNTELFARAIELFIKDKQYLKNNAPTLYDQINKSIETSRVPELKKLISIIENKS